MDKKEFSTLVMAIRTYYPREDILPNTQAMELWYRELQDIPYAVAETSLRKWVSMNKWSPTIADLREAAAAIKGGDAPDWGDGWGQVLRAISRYGTYREDEAMKGFDEITRAAVKRIGFRNICLSEDLNQDRANFRMIYEQIANRKKMDAQIAEPLKALIDNIQKEGNIKLIGD